MLFVMAGAVIWLAAGRLIDTIDRLARRLRRSGFTVAFFILGFLTSIGESSVALNSLVAGSPQVAAGNLTGASMVLLLFLVPLTAIMANGIYLQNTLDRTQLALALSAAALPALFLLDGGASRMEGLIVCWRTARCYSPYAGAPGPFPRKSKLCWRR
jgi:cation:H+ antiporter